MEEVTLFLTDAHREECHLIMEWHRQGPSRITGKHQNRGKVNRFSLSVLRRSQPCPHLNFGLPAFRTVRECISVLLSPLFCIICYNSPRKLIFTPQTPNLCALGKKKVREISKCQKTRPKEAQDKVVLGLRGSGGGVWHGREDRLGWIWVPYTVPVLEGLALPQKESQKFHSHIAS